MKSKRAVIAITLLAAAAVALSSCLTGCAPHRAGSEVKASAEKVKKDDEAATAEGTVEPHCPVMDATVDTDTLPWARTNAVIPGLIALESAETWVQVHTLNSDAVLLYDLEDGEASPIAWQERSLSWEEGEPQPIVVVDEDEACGWSLILTQSRKSVPAEGQPAPAQTAAWVRSDDLSEMTTKVAKPVVVNRAAKTLTIAGRTFDVVVGDPDQTPTPATTTFILSRFFDGTQNTRGYEINLLAAHSAELDEFANNSGELAAHVSGAPDGSGSHGCIRIPPEAADILSSVPLGTPVEIR